MKIGINTFGIGKLLRMDFEGTLAALQNAGVTSIEFNIDFKQGRDGIPKFVWLSMKVLGILDGFFPYDKAGILIEKCRSKGFAVHSIQADNVKWNVQGMQAVVDFCKNNRVSYVSYSFKEKSVAHMQEYLNETRRIVTLLKSNGIQLLAHNHQEEFQNDNGTNAMTVLLEQVPEIGVELDVGWAEYAGISSVEFMKKYANRIYLIHLKDIKPGKIKDRRENFCVATGTGFLPLKEILEQSRQLSLDSEGYIIDQDNSVSGDILADTAEGIVNINRIMENLHQIG